MIDEDFEVIITDLDQVEIYHETLNSGDNGFISMWLPRDNNFDITIKNKDMEASSVISTFKEDSSCITIMKMN